MTHSLNRRKLSSLLQWLLLPPVRPCLRSPRRQRTPSAGSDADLPIYGVVWRDSALDNGQTGIRPERKLVLNAAGCKLCPRFNA
jgi:hypothetical protein